MIRLLDVSAYQPTALPWPAIVLADVAGVYVKASEGMGWRNQHFDGQIEGARANTRRVGAYHFAHSGNSAAQVDNFWAASGGLGSEAGDMPPVLDVERAPNPPELATVQALIAAIEELWGCLPVIYGGHDWLDQLGLDAHCPLWLAAYPAHLEHAWPTDAEPWPELAPWGKPRMWQFSGAMQLGGVTMDASVFDGDAAAFGAFCTTSRV